MSSKLWLSLALALGLSGRLLAGAVMLEDGTMLSGELKKQDNGDVIVVTGAGELRVAKDKIKSVVEDSTTSSGVVENSYVGQVQARRQKYGNEDGLPRTSLLLSRQVSFSLGMLNYSGDGLNLGRYASTSDFNGLHYGLALANNFNDIVGWELWTGYSQGEKGFTFTPTGDAARATIQRVDIGFTPRLQKAIPLGAVEQNMHIIPHIGMGPMFTYLTGSSYLIRGNNIDSESISSSAIGFGLVAGADLQLGPALIGVKFRYLLSYDVTGSLPNSSNLSATLPQFSLGWAF
ncbi:MAG: hypothetical protein V4498_04590 [candidate division FCPU426 bacterium]